MPCVALVGHDRCVCAPPRRRLQCSAPSDETIAAQRCAGSCSFLALAGVQRCWHADRKGSEPLNLHCSSAKACLSSVLRPLARFFRQTFLGPTAAIQSQPCPIRRTHTPCSGRQPAAQLQRHACNENQSFALHLVKVRKPRIAHRSRGVQALPLQQEEKQWPTAPRSTSRTTV